MQKYQQIELSFQGPSTGITLRRPPFMANWDNDVLFLSSSGIARQAELLINADASHAVPWLAKVRKIAAEMPARRYSENEDLQAHMKVLIDLLCALSGLREIHLLPLGSKLVMPWDQDSSCFVDSCYNNLRRSLFHPTSPEQPRTGEGPRQGNSHMRSSSNSYPACMDIWKSYVSGEMASRGREVVVKVQG